LSSKPSCICGYWRSALRLICEARRESSANALFIKCKSWLIVWKCIAKYRHRNLYCMPDHFVTSPVRGWNILQRNFARVDGWMATGKACGDWARDETKGYYKMVLLCCTSEEIMLLNHSPRRR
jgi:hypothetical protein